MTTDDESPTPAHVLPAAPHRGRLRNVAFYGILVLLNLIVLEITLRAIDLRAVRLFSETDRLPFDHDPELGWYPIPNYETTAGHKINSMGLNDFELVSTDQPTILFIGDSFVYGSGVAPQDRFTDRLRRDLPGFRIVNAGVAGYGTDQEFLLLRRLWAKIEPQVVILVVCVENDHRDNSTNSRNGHTLKPYLANVEGQWRFQGQPAPRSQTWYYYHSWFANHSATVRLMVLLYMHLRYPPVVVPDPTNQLVGMMRDFVESQGAKFLVGLQLPDQSLEPFLQAEKIPYIRFDGAATFPNDMHWNPQGHLEVAERLREFFGVNGVLSLARR